MRRQGVSLTGSAHRNERHGWFCSHADDAVWAGCSFLWCLRGAFVSAAARQTHGTLELRSCLPQLS